MNRTNQGGILPQDREMEGVSPNDKFTRAASETSILLFTTMRLPGNDINFPLNAAILSLRKNGMDVRRADFVGNSGGRQTVFVVTVESDEATHHEVIAVGDLINRQLKDVGFTTVELCRVLEIPKNEVVDELRNAAMHAKATSERLIAVAEMLAVV